MALSKAKQAEYQRERRKRLKGVIPSVIPKPASSVIPELPESVIPKLSTSGVFVPLEPCYIDLLEQEYRQYGGLAQHISKLLAAKAKEVDRRIEESRPVVIPIDPLPKSG